MLAVFEVVGRIIAVRLFLFLALIGAFVLALYAMSWQTTAALAVLISYCVLSVLPLVALEWRGRVLAQRGLS